VTAALQCAGVAGGHGDVVVFRELDLDLAAGEVLALLGPNGAGKTTFLLTLAGLLKSAGGTISVEDHPLPSGNPAAANRAGIVLVPDNRCLFTTMTVEDNLRVACRRGGSTPRDILETFPALERRWRVKAGALSGGEQQMLAIARALVQRPKVLLIDELSMGLAPMVVESLFEVIGTIGQLKECAVVLVEQYVRLALEAADTALVLNHGRVVARSAAAELLAHPEVLEQAYFGSAEAGPEALVTAVAPKFSTPSIGATTVAE
jgi:branched-chain amino acid transport system ATP-binding protein